MRWERLFDDIEAQADEALRAERDTEVADRAEREVGRQQLTDRLRAAVGGELTFRLVGAGSVHGIVRTVGAGWAVVEERPGVDALIPLRGVEAVLGLGARAAVPGSEGAVGARLGFSYALRRMADDRADVVLTLSGGTAMRGVIARVGADFVDVAADTGTTATIPHEALAVVRRMAT